MTILTRRALVKGGTALTAGALSGPALLEWSKAWAQSSPWKPEPGAQLSMLRWKYFVQAEDDAFVKLLEAFTQATGVPVACSNVTSLPEVVGDAAILFNPRVPDDIAQAILSLAHDKELTARLVQAGNLRAADFSNSRLMAQKYWEVFEQARRKAIQSDILLGAHGDG